MEGAKSRRGQRLTAVSCVLGELECPAARILEMASSEASEDGPVLLQKRIRETSCGSPQQEKKFASPQKNVQQATALQIVEVFTMQGHIQGLPGTLLDKRPQRRQIERHAADPLAPRSEERRVGKGG